MQINLYSIEELKNYIDQPIILSSNDLTVSGILSAVELIPETPYADTFLKAEVHISDGESAVLGLRVHQDDLSSGQTTISAHKEVLPINPSALIYIHAASVELSEAQLATPHSYSQSSGYWVPITGTRKTPVKADDITDFEIISLPKPSVPTAEEAVKSKTKVKPEAKPLPLPENLRFPHIASMAESFGIRAYDDGTVSIGSSRFSMEELQNSALFGPILNSVPEKLMTTLEERYRKEAEAKGK